MWNYFSRKTVMDHDSSQSRLHTEKVKTTGNKNSWFVTRHLFYMSACIYGEEAPVARARTPLLKKFSLTETQLPLFDTITPVYFKLWIFLLM